MKRKIGTLVLTALVVHLVIQCCIVVYNLQDGIPKGKHGHLNFKQILLKQILDYVSSKGLVFRETEVLCRWGSNIQKLGFIN